MYASDQAIIDKDGYGCIVGRMKDMIIRGGENIYPLEIEQFLYKHPKIADVQVRIEVVTQGCQLTPIESVTHSFQAFHILTLKLHFWSG